MTTEPKPRPWPGPQEHELIPYRAWSDWTVRSLLVLAPHPDDEVFGCGGLLLLARRQGWRCHVVVVSDGAAGGDMAMREAESLAAARVLGGDEGARSIEFWRQPDRGVLPGAPLTERIVRAAAVHAADWVVAPSPLEVHPDHRAVCRAAIDAVASLQAQGRATRLVFCEIGQPLIANALVDITEVARLKALASQCFASQLTQQDYHQHVEGLNRQRSYTLGPTVTHAEAFWIVDPQDLKGGADGVLAGIARAMHRRL